MMGIPLSMHHHTHEGDFTMEQPNIPSMVDAFSVISNNFEIVRAEYAKISSVPSVDCAQENRDTLRRVEEMLTKVPRMQKHFKH
jgi:hypothetical protein